MIELRGVTFGYGAGTATLDVPELDIGAGLTLVMGQNGSGKSTLLRLIAGVEPPRTGTIAVDGHDLWRDEIAARRQLAYVPESPELTPYTTVFDAMQLVASLRRVPSHAMVEALDRVGLFDLAGRTVRELSMGQRRRAMLATALIGEPKLIILDEPLETLDVDMRGFVVEWVARLRNEGKTIVLATHDHAAFLPVTDRIIRVRSGRIESGSA